MTPQEAFAKWKDGAHLAELAAELGWRRSKLRKEITRAVGGKDVYRKLRADGAGGQMELFGGRRASATYAPPDDSRVPVIHRALLKKGWKLDRVFPAGLTVDVHVSPEGKRYIEAKPTEKADLIYDSSRVKGLAPMRLRLFEGSSLAKKVKKHEKLVKHGEELLDKKTERRRERRKHRVRRKR